LLHLLILRQQHRLRLTTVKVLGFLGVAIATLSVPAAVADPVRTQVADCEGPTVQGSGPPDWRQRSIVAGPLGVFRRPLSQMSRTGNGQLITKMPIIVAGSTSVTLSVPSRLRHRVFLYYGRYLDRSGKPTTLIGRSRGFSEVVFEPCDHKPRTPWPGGIRVKGRRAVRLIVRAEGSPKPTPLPLGRPRAYAPAAR
jgi:hypothetical protein